MADKQSGLSKKFPQNSKKKNRAKKKSSASKCSIKNATKQNSPKNNRSREDNGHSKRKTNEDNYADNSLTIRNHGFSPEQEYHDPSDRTHKYPPSDRGKLKRGYANVGANWISTRQFRDENQDYYSRNRVRDRTFNETEYVNNDIALQTSHSSENIDSLLQRIDYLTSTVDNLTQENEKLNHTLYDINYNWTVLSDSDVDVIFKKKELAEKFSHVLQGLLSKLLNGSISVEDLNKFCSLWQSDEIKDSPEPDCLFAVDNSADPVENVESGNTSIPIYDSSFHEFLVSPTEASPKKENRGSKFTSNCFNCGEDHHLNTCPRKLDFRKIAVARKKSRPFFAGSARYHVHGKNENDFKPGNISDELREALSLNKTQIPPYVYRMRILDYPPGWLHEAAVESSGITLYGSDGNVEKEENQEDGEVEPTGIRVQYDPDKLVDYPGFNIPLPPDVIDESYELGLPALQTHQLRCIIEKNMPKPDTRPSRKRKLTLKDDRPSKIQRCEEDMEIGDSDSEAVYDNSDFSADFVPPLPDSAPPPPPPPPSPPPLPVDNAETSEDIELSKFVTDSPDENSSPYVESAVGHFKSKSCSDFSSGTSSPSLVELEELKKKLVMELCIGLDDDPSSNTSQDEESSQNTHLGDDKNSEERYYIEEEFIASENGSDLSNNSDSNTVLNESSDIPDSPKSPQRTPRQSKCVTLGTPSISQHSSFSKLPDYDQFSKNVSSHIHFENLPDSTGTYQKMRNVLKKVKDKLNSMMQ